MATLTDLRPELVTIPSGGTTLQKNAVTSPPLGWLLFDSELQQYWTGA